MFYYLLNIEGKRKMRQSLEAIKAKRLEKLILDFTKWLDVNSEKVTAKEIKIYWKKLIEDYVFEYIEKVISILSEIKTKVP